MGSTIWIHSLDSVQLKQSILLSYISLVVLDRFSKFFFCLLLFVLWLFGYPHFFLLLPVLVSYIRGKTILNCFLIFNLQVVVFLNCLNYFHFIASFFFFSLLIHLIVFISTTIILSTCFLLPNTHKQSMVSPVVVLQTFSF